MKYTLAITQKCNLACDYCYIRKNNSVMSLATAKKIVDSIFLNTPKNEKIDIGFFGGEPLLELDLIRKITGLIQNHKFFEVDRVMLSIVSNGTIFSEEIKDFLIEKKVGFGISCDGPSFVQDVKRHFPDGRGSSRIVEKNIREALRFFEFMPVNAVYSPGNLRFLPDVVDYLSSLGVKNIYLNHNISAKWTQKEADMLPQIYDAIGKKYMNFYRQEEPRHISLIDSKIVVILRGGYKSLERCRMGIGEFAFAPSGNIYPCERLISSDDGKTHCIGNINDKVTLNKKCKNNYNVAINNECQICGLNMYCMNWCGCTNYYSTKNYRTVGPFVCASEKASINTALKIINELGKEEITFSDHLAGTPLYSILGESLQKNYQHTHRTYPAII